MSDYKPTDQELHNFVTEVCQRLADLGSRMEPQEFAAMFTGGIIANVVGNMPQNYWQEFSRVEPCGRPGCDCHLVLQPKIMKALETLRNDHMKYKPESLYE